MKFGIVSLALFALASVEARVGRDLMGRTPSPPKDVCYDEKKCKACPVYKQGGVNWQDPNNCPYCDPTAPDCPPSPTPSPTLSPTPSPTLSPTPSPPKDVCYDEKKCKACPVYKQGGVNWQDPNNCPYCDPTAPDCPPSPTPSPTPSPPKDVCYDEKKCKECPVYKQGGVNWQDPNNCPYCDPTAPDCPPSPTPSPTLSPTPSPPKDVCYDEKKCKACPVYKQGGVNWQDPNNCPYCDPTAPDCPQYGMCTKDVTWCSTGGNEAASTQCAPCCNQEFDSSNERKDCQHACKETYLNTCSGEWDENWERFLQRTGEQIPDPNFLN